MKKYLNIKLNVTNSVAEEIVLMAARANAGKDVTFQDMESYVKMQVLRYPTTNEGIQCHIIGNNFILDRGTECLMEIEEREIYELVPTLASYEHED